MWIAVSDREPVGISEITFGSNKQVKVVFTYKGTAYLGLGLFTRWKNGESEWAELCENKNNFTEMNNGVPTHYIILPEIP